MISGAPVQRVLQEKTRPNGEAVGGRWRRGVAHIFSFSLFIPLNKLQRPHQIITPEILFEGCKINLS
jgi:hypothetical protein